MINLRLVFLFVLTFLFYSCKRSLHEFYFDVKNQKVISCDKVRFYELFIKNDSITEDNFPYESGKILVWKGDRGFAPYEFSFNKIPESFYFFKGKSAKRFKFKSNCRYIIEKGGGGSPSFRIKVWTDSKGKVYKTTHPSCGLETLSSSDFVRRSSR